MGTTDLLAAHTKTIIAGSAVYLGFTLSEWAAIFGIVFAIVNTLAVLPATLRAIKSFFTKEQDNGSK